LHTVGDLQFTGNDLFRLFNTMDAPLKEYSAAGSTVGILWPTTHNESAVSIPVERDSIRLHSIWLDEKI
jgi:hypothetical protein